MWFVKTLETAEILTATAADDLDALTKFTELQPDLALLDLNMPRATALTPAGKSAAFLMAAPPVLIVTGHVGDDLAHRAFEAGATEPPPD